MVNVSFDGFGLLKIYGFLSGHRFSGWILVEWVSDRWAKFQ